MGLTSWSGDRPRKADVATAKNYLTEDEIQALNLIVSAYLDFAELQAHSRKPMYMADWIRKLDDFIRLSDREILTHAGKISHDTAVAKAEAEFDKFRTAQAALPAARGSTLRADTGRVGKARTATEVVAPVEARGAEEEAGAA